MTTTKVKRSCCQPGATPSVATEKPEPVFMQRTASITTASITMDGGWFLMGSEDNPYPEDGEFPERRVYVDPFSLAESCVTIDEYQTFVSATGYLSVAEQIGSSFVFYQQVESPDQYSAPSHAPWWRQVPGACWHSPNGTINQQDDIGTHPVTHIARIDALAYCQWSGTRLPTESEWEYAARGPLVSKPYPWGDDLTPNGQHRANLWQGDFPEHNTGEDGFTSTAPVTAYGRSGFGHFNMIGNVWEWVSDRFTDRHSPRPVKNPTGPLNGHRFVAKGGSYLCHASYCARYRTSSRQGLPADTTAGNIGFRVVVEV